MDSAISELEGGGTHFSPPTHHKKKAKTPLVLPLRSPVTSPAQDRTLMGGLEVAAYETHGLSFEQLLSLIPLSHSPYNRHFSGKCTSVFSERSKFQSHLHQKTFLF